MTTPELHPEGANGAADRVATIGIEANRIRNMALDVPGKTVKVDRTAARIAEAAKTILAQTQALEAAPPEAGAEAPGGAQAAGYSPSPEERSRWAAEEEIQSLETFFRLAGAAYEIGEREDCKNLLSNIPAGAGTTPAITMARAAAVLVITAIGIDDGLLPAREVGPAVIRDMLEAVSTKLKAEIDAF